MDDFIGQGGTLANLRGWIEKQGGIVVGAMGLAGKPFSAQVAGEILAHKDSVAAD